MLRRVESPASGADGVRGEDIRKGRCPDPREGKATALIGTLLSSPVV
jgi:hypothetical protein